MLILILFFLALPLQAADLSPFMSAEEAFARDNEFLKIYKLDVAQRAILAAESELACAQENARSEEDIKKFKAAVKKKAEEMLFMLANLKEDGVSLGDIDFCLARNPDVHAVDDIKVSLLMRAAEHQNITMVRELIRAGVDVDYATETSLGDDTTALVSADKGDGNLDNPIFAILLEAGITFPKGYWWLWNEDMSVHRQRMIGIINDLDFLPTQLSPVIINYAFGKPPKINPETEEGYYSDNEIEEGDKE